MEAELIPCGLDFQSDTTRQSESPTSLVTLMLFPFPASEVESDKELWAAWLRFNRHWVLGAFSCRARTKKKAAMSPTVEVRTARFRDKRCERLLSIDCIGSEAKSG